MEPGSPPESPASGLRAAVAEQFARRRSRASPFNEGLDAVDDNRAVAYGALNTAPLSPRQVIGDLADPVRFHIQMLEVIDDQVGPRAFAQDSAVAETGRVSGQRREAIMRLLERDALLVAHQPSEEIGGE